MQLLIFLAILSLVVVIHELGHLLAAKFFRVRVDEFGFGLPPRVKRLFRKGETDYSLNLLPIGGFVRLYGENGERELDVPDSRAFFGKKVWERAIIVVAGVVMNFALSVVLFAIVYSFLGIPSKIDGVKVGEIRPDSPAARAGLSENDVIVRVKTEEKEIEIEEIAGFLEVIDQSKGKEVEIGLSDERVIKVTPRVLPPEGEGSLGIVITDIELRKYPFWQMPFRGVVVGFSEAFAWGKEILGGFGKMITRLLSGKGLEEGLAGPVGIYQITNQVRKSGVLPLIQFVGVLSVNLAILNILPFPALDGGRLVFLFVEMIIGKRVKDTVEGWVHSVGMVILLTLMVLITANDLLRLAGGWSGLLSRFGM